MILTSRVWFLNIFQIERVQIWAMLYIALLPSCMFSKRQAWSSFVITPFCHICGDKLKSKFEKFAVWDGLCLYPNFSTVFIISYSITAI